MMPPSMVPLPKTDVVIVGAGISGLVTAWFLKKRGADVRVLEHDNEVGGTMKTVKDGGWLVETGPNSALETTPIFKDLFVGLKLEQELVYANPIAQNRYILRQGRLHALPMSPPALLKSRLWSMGGKLRILGEPFVRRGTGEETIAQFVERRLGRELLDYAINPFVAGVYAGDPAKLSVKAAFPKLFALEEKYGSLIKGQIKGAKERKKRGEVSKDRAQLFTFRSGMQVLPKRLEEHLQGIVVCGVSVDRLTGDENGYRLECMSEGKPVTIEARSVVLCIPAKRAASLVESFDLEVARQLRSIYYPPVAEIFLGYRTTDVGRVLDGFGFLVPQKESRNILGTIWSSSLFGGRAPAGHAALTTFVGGARQPDLAGLCDTELVELVQKELAEILRAAPGPVYQKVTRWKEAIPQYEIGHLEKVAVIEKLEKTFPGLYLRGNYRGGIAVGDCVMQAARTAEEILAKLSQHVEVKT